MALWKGCPFATHCSFDWCCVGCESSLSHHTHFFYSGSLTESLKRGHCQARLHCLWQPCAQHQGCCSCFGIALFHKTDAVAIGNLILDITVERSKVLYDALLYWLPASGEGCSAKTSQKKISVLPKWTDDFSCSDHFPEYPKYFDRIIGGVVSVIARQVDVVPESGLLPVASTSLAYASRSCL